MSTAALNLTSLVLNGQDAGRHYADLIGAVTSLRMTETITGASTIEVGLTDPQRKAIESKALTERSTVVLDRAAFELVKVSKQGPNATATLEDLNVARLRRHKSYRAAAPGTTTRPEFVRTLISEEPDIKVVTGTGAGKDLVQIARGTGKPNSGRSKVGDDGSVVDSGQEDTWTAGGRILGEIGWRLFAYRGVVYQATDAWLMAHNGKPYALAPTSKGVIDIDFEHDTGKPAASATLYLNAGIHDIAPGTPLDLSRLGAANGRWLVETIERSPFTTDVTVTAIRPQPSLPEPKDASAGGEAGITGWNGEYLGDSASAGGVADDFNLVSVTPIGPGIAGPKGAVGAALVNLALAQRGKPYVYGASGPNSWDCSGFVQDMASRLGVRFPKPVSAQAARVRSAGTTLSIERASYTAGAILWHERGGGMNDHIVICIGDGEHTIEAMGSAYGVVVGKIKGRRTPWTGAGWVPGIHVSAPASRDLRPG